MYINIRRIKQSYPTAVKTLSFACVHFVTAFTVAWLLSGSLLVGGLIAMVEPLVNTGMFYLHERLWQARGGASDDNSESPFAYGTA